MQRDSRCESLTKIIGLTGPTGAGKTTISQIFADFGCVLVDCDKIAYEVTTYNVDCLKDLCYAFGSDILNETGSLNRTLLAQRAFATKEQTQKLNDVTHPWILKEIHMLMKQYQRQGVKTLVLDAPLLFESGLQHACHQTVSVLAPLKVRLSRIMERDGLTEEQALQRIHAQPTDAFYESQSDMILDGCKTHRQLSDQIANWLREEW